MYCANIGITSKIAIKAQDMYVVYIFQNQDWQQTKVLFWDRYLYFFVPKYNFWRLEKNVENEDLAG